MKSYLRPLTIFLGAFLAVAIVFAQLFHFQLSQQPKKEVKTEQQEKQTAGDEAFYSAVTSFSIPSPAHIELDVESFCLFEIGGEEASDEKHTLDIPEYASGFLQTLFSVIISPNAP